MIKNLNTLVNALSEERLTVYVRQAGGGFWCAARWGGVSIRPRVELPHISCENATAIYFHGLPHLAKATMADLLDIGAKVFLCDFIEKIVPIRRPDIEAENLFTEFSDQFRSYPMIVGYVSLSEEGTNEAAVDGAVDGIDAVRNGLRKDQRARNP